MPRVSSLFARMLDHVPTGMDGCGRLTRLQHRLGAAWEIAADRVATLKGGGHQGWCENSADRDIHAVAQTDGWMRWRVNERVDGQVDGRMAG
eukprot:263530-Chlamydomonas_euryale.AAC.1